MTADEVTLAVLTIPLPGRVSSREAQLRFLLAVAADPDSAEGYRIPGISTPPGPEATRAVLAFPLPRQRERITRREAMLRVLAAVSTFPADDDGYRLIDTDRLPLVACLLPVQFRRACDDLIAAGLLDHLPLELPEARP